MAFSFFSFARYVLKSKNQHGVHSPFVFHFVTKGLYKKLLHQENQQILELYQNKTSDLTKRQIKLIFKILKYFTPSHCSIELSQYKDTIDILNLLDKFNVQLKPDQKNKYDILISDTEYLKDHFQSYCEKMHNDSTLLLVEKVSHLNNKGLWRNLKDKREVKVSIDLYNIRLIFIRKQQVKEHFIIRV